MGKIIKLSSVWTQESIEKIGESLDDALDDEFIVIADPEMEAFEYDDLEKVTVYEDEVAEILDVDSTDEVNFAENETLYDGME